MNRRDFLRRAALVATGAVAADQLELLDRLGWARRWFAGWSEPVVTGIVSSAEGHVVTITSQQWDALLRDAYTDYVGMQIPLTTPFLEKMRPRDGAFVDWANAALTAGRRIEVVRG